MSSHLSVMQCVARGKYLLRGAERLLLKCYLVEFLSKTTPCLNLWKLQLLSKTTTVLGDVHFYLGRELLFGT